MSKEMPGKPGRFDTVIPNAKSTLPNP